MAECYLCKKKVSIWNVYTDRNKEFCKDCWKNRQEDIKKIFENEDNLEKKHYEEARETFHCPNCKGIFKLNQVNEDKKASGKEWRKNFTKGVFRGIGGGVIGGVFHAGINSEKVYLCPKCNEYLIMGLPK